jgi:hypothetical protein
VTAARTLAPFGRRRALVVSARSVGAYVLVEVADRGGPDPDPGQFYMLATQSGWGAGEDERPFLPARDLRHGRAGRDAVVPARGHGPRDGAPGARRQG